MKKLIWCAAVVVAFGCLAIAQESQSSEAKQSSISGCLSGPNAEGSYTLKTKAHSVEVAGTDELKNHVGHEVKLTGSWAKAGTEMGEKESAEKTEAAEKSGTEKQEAAEAGESHAGGERHFKADKVDMISASCSQK